MGASGAPAGGTRSIHQGERKPGAEIGENRGTLGLHSLKFSLNLCYRRCTVQCTVQYHCSHFSQFSQRVGDYVVGRSISMFHLYVADSAKTAQAKSEDSTFTGCVCIHPRVPWALVTSARSEWERDATFRSRRWSQFGAFNLAQSPLWRTAAFPLCGPFISKWKGTSQTASVPAPKRRQFPDILRKLTHCTKRYSINQDSVAQCASFHTPCYCITTYTYTLNVLCADGNCQVGKSLANSFLTYVRVCVHLCCTKYTCVVHPQCTTWMDPARQMLHIRPS